MDFDLGGFDQKEEGELFVLVRMSFQESGCSSDGEQVEIQESDNDNDINAVHRASSREKERKKT